MTDYTACLALPIVNVQTIATVIRMCNMSSLTTGLALLFSKANAAFAALKMLAWATSLTEYSSARTDV